MSTLLGKIERLAQTSAPIVGSLGRGSRGWGRAVMRHAATPAAAGSGVCVALAGVGFLAYAVKLTVADRVVDGTQEHTVARIQGRSLNWA